MKNICIAIKIHISNLNIIAYINQKIGTLIFLQYIKWFLINY